MPGFFSKSLSRSMSRLELEMVLSFTDPEKYALFISHHLFVIGCASAKRKKLLRTNNRLSQY